jgi:hypothetical protein
MRSERGRNAIGTRSERGRNAVGTRSERGRNAVGTRSERGRNAVGTRLERVPEETWKCVLTLIKNHVLACNYEDPFQFFSILLGFRDILKIIFKPL